MMANPALQSSSERSRTLPAVYTRGLSERLDLYLGVAHQRLHGGGETASGLGNPALGASQRFAIGWLTQVNASQLQALMTAQLTAMQLQGQVPDSVLAQFSQMVPLIGLVGYGVVNDPTPDRNVRIDLTTGTLQAQ